VALAAVAVVQCPLDAPRWRSSIGTAEAGTTPSTTRPGCRARGSAVWCVSWC